MNAQLSPGYRALAPTALTLILALGCTAPPPPEAQTTAADDFPVLSGDYFGQTPPGSEPELFAPGVVSTGLFERDFAMTPDGIEIFWSVVLGRAHVTIVTSKQVDGRWTEPEVAPFATDPDHMYIEPFISHDGRRLYFVSDRPREEGGEVADQNIWVLERTVDGWSVPYLLDPSVNSEHPEYFPSLTRDGHIYFTREADDGSNAIYRSRLVEGTYAEPEMLGPEVNAGTMRFNALIAPDESYLIVPIVGLEDSVGSTDYYVCFRNDDDTWLPPINMGDKVNSPSGAEYSPALSPDGKYFFFMSSRTVPDSAPASLTYEWLKDLYNRPQNGSPDVYWIDASFIEQLRPGS